MRILFLIAMESELRNIFDLSPYQLVKDASFPTFISKSPKNEIIIVQTGIGEVNAAAATQYALGHFHVDLIVNLGIAGSLQDTLTKGKIFHINKVVFGDVDITAWGYALGHIPGAEGPVYALNTAHALNGIPSATLLTTHSFITQRETIARHIVAYKPDLIDMEGAAIAHVLALHSQLEKLSIYKAVSDGATELSTSELEELRENENLIPQKFQALVSSLLSDC